MNWNINKFYEMNIITLKNKSNTLVFNLTKIRPQKKNLFIFNLISFLQNLTINQTANLISLIIEWNLCFYEMNIIMVKSKSNTFIFNLTKFTQILTISLFLSKEFYKYC